MFNIRLPRIVSTLIFLVFFSGVLYVASLIVYTAVIVSFGVSSSEKELVLAILLGVFSASFILATIIGTYYYNWFTRLLYTLSALWMGCLAYLFFGSVLYGLVVGFSDSVLQPFGILCILGGLLVSIYGYLHARNIVVKQVSVPLPNLPASWRGRKAVWISDVHLGQHYGPAFAKKIIDMINATPHDIVFIGGDLYDGTGAPDIEELAKPFGKCTAPLGTYFISGNHEEYGDNKRFFNAISTVGVKTLIDEMVVIDGVQVIGLDYRNASYEGTFEATLARLGVERDTPSILLKHVPLHLEIAEKAGISFQISGHTHDGQLWPFGYIARAVHRGYSYGLKQYGKMRIYISSGTGTWGPPLRVGTDCEIVVFTFV